MSSTLPGPISLNAQSCIRLFRSLIDLLEHDSASNNIDLTDIQVQDELGRFQLWAGNTGAIQGSFNRTSLDFRLKDTPFVAKQVLDFLLMLSHGLGEGKSTFLFAIVFANM